MPTIQTLDILWSKIIRKLFPVCCRCKMAKSTTAAHIYGKKIAPGLRHDVDNGLGMCMDCHEICDHGANRQEILDLARSIHGVVKFEALSSRRYEDHKYRDLEQVEQELISKL